MPENKPSVPLSIIVPVYNNPHDLTECVAALLNESGAETEIVVGDDASTDETPALAACLGCRDGEERRTRRRPERRRESGTRRGPFLRRL